MTRRKSETALESRIPPLNALKAFEAAGRLNITRAAEELSVTPGAISQQIRILEQHAGAPLFHREGRQIALTDLGAELYPLLRDGFDHLKRAGDLLYRPDRRHALAVSVPPSFAAKWRRASRASPPPILRSKCGCQPICAWRMSAAAVSMWRFAMDVATIPAFDRNVC